MSGNVDSRYFGLGIVRDKNGKPKFDDLDNMPEGYKMAYRHMLTADDKAKLSPEEKQKLGVKD